ncbi:MAG: ribosome biogenesis GTP-binding protein YihA/YsxC [Nitrospirae bacterium]|nr:ribosome biogenesis GTP-binding protein YihA/YsxC [Nitrospirota bacterium]MCL5285310.1 ribosome biogenesis GTP-binding protein YihA/YsxC [Nitrospirota bacterium]
MKPRDRRGGLPEFPSIFLLSVASPSQMPSPGGFGIIGLAGRSNVGKSSLINRLAGAHRLARTGKRPGATTLPNLYRILSGGYFLDFPGYGYMNRSQGIKKSSQDISTTLVESRPDISAILLCVDIRREVLPADQEAARWFFSRGLPVAVVLTKLDTLSGNGRTAQIRNWKRWIEEEEAEGLLGLYPVSARSGEGIPEVAALVGRILSGFPGGGRESTGEECPPV